jgi:hypothetical protein
LYVTIAARQMVGIVLLVLVKRPHAPFVREVMTADAGTGVLRAGGNKGAVTCRFALYDKTISFVACHLAAHEQNVERRNQEFGEIIRRSVFVRDPAAAEQPSPFAYLDYDNAPPPDSLNVLEHDVVFWIGDLNYRIQLPSDQVMNLVAREDWKQLRKYDQLDNARLNGEAFQGFEEGILDFAPTYKLEKDANNYSMKECEDKSSVVVKRTPSWTDRVLYRDRVRSSPRNIVSNESHERRIFQPPSPLDAIKDAGVGDAGGFGDAEKHRRKNQRQRGLRLNCYERHEVLSSDHRPVSAGFTLDFRVIDVRSRNRVVQHIHRDLKRRENALRPRQSVSSLAVKLGPVEPEP